MVGAWVRLRLQSRLAYRGDLVLASLGDVLLAAVGLVMLGTIFLHVDRLAGFTARDVLLGWGLAQASLGLFQAAFAGLYAMNRQYLLQGDLDRVLLRPVDPWLQVMLDHLNPGALLTSLAGLAVFAWAVEPGFELLLLPVFVVCGALLVAGILTATAALGFFVHHEGSAVGLVHQLAGFAPWPVTILPGPFALIALPFAFAGFVPATLYMDRPEWWPLALAQPVVGVAVFVAGLAFWRLGLRRYGSAGS